MMKIICSSRKHLLALFVKLLNQASSLGITAWIFLCFIEVGENVFMEEVALLLVEYLCLLFSSSILVFPFFLPPCTSFYCCFPGTGMIKTFYRSWVKQWVMQLVVKLLPLLIYLGQMKQMSLEMRMNPLFIRLLVLVMRRYSVFPICSFITIRSLMNI